MATSPSHDPPDQEMPDAPPEELDGGSPDLPVEEEDDDDEESESGEDDPNENDQEEILKDASREEEEDDDEQEEDLESIQDSKGESLPPTVKPPKDPRSRKRRRREKLLQDCLSVRIPMQGGTADLGFAMRRTRRKRLAGLQKAFPGLGGPTAEESAAATGDVIMEAVDEDEKESERQRQSDRQKPASPKKKLLHVPQREDFANVVDYLEAKYVQGVMINDEEDASPLDPSTNGGKEDDDDEEGQGSVYSQTSFLDDDDLQRDVAEQVLAQSTTTKLELESNEDDAFFVNIGTLEVEETYLTQDGYDPLKDVSTETKKKPKKKRKPAEKKDDKSTTKDDKSSAKSEAKKAPVKKKESKDAGATAGKASSPKKKADPSSPKKKATPSKTATKPAVSKKKESAAKTPAEKAAAGRKKALDAAYQAVIGIVNSMTLDELPRRKTKEKVAVTCPADKKAGDTILFANPHFSGQRLRVKIPKNTAPGATFRVTVPVAPIAVEDEEEGKDHNKWSRDFYDAFGEYCVVFDEWVDLVAVAKKEAGDKDYVVYYQKRLKFDQLIKDAPSDLKTPLEKTYMQKLLRRARQNRHKRERTLKRQEERTKELQVDPSEDQDEEDGDDKEADESVDREEAAQEKPPASPPPREDPTSQTVLVPALVTVFPTVTFDSSQF